MTYIDLQIVQPLIEARSEQRASDINIDDEELLGQVLCLASSKALKKKTVSADPQP